MTTPCHSSNPLAICLVTSLDWTTKCTNIHNVCTFVLQRSSCGMLTVGIHYLHSVSTAGLFTLLRSIVHFIWSSNPVIIHNKCDIVERWQ